MSRGVWWRGEGQHLVRRLTGGLGIRPPQAASSCLGSLAQFLTLRSARRCGMGIITLIGAVVVIIVILKLLGLW